MKLNLVERIVILEILPKENNFVTLKLIRDLMSKLGISAEEHIEFKVKEIKNENGTVNITWNTKGNEDKEIIIGEKESDLIFESLDILDKQKKLTDKHISIYEKFKR